MSLPAAIEALETIRRIEKDLTGGEIEGITNRFAHSSNQKFLIQTVKARVVGGCLVITLPSLIRKESGIGEDDRVELRLDKEKDEITLSWSKGETE